MNSTIGKRAEMGVGTLIVFIAFLLTAAIAAGVLIQTNGNLQEKSFVTGDQAKGQVTTNVRVIEVRGVDGSNGDIEFLEQTIQLSPGSNPVKLTQTLLTVNTYDTTTVLTYRGVNSTTDNEITNGYHTVSTNETLPDLDNVTRPVYNLSNDYDNDNGIDSVTLTAGSAYLNFSFTGTNSLLITDFNCSGATHSVAGTYLTPNSDEIEQIVVTGSCGGEDTSGTTIVVYPVEAGVGVYTIEYLQRGNNPIDGNLQTGDVVKLFMELPRSIVEAETVRMNLVPKIGASTLTQFITPDVITEESVYLYPLQ